MSLYWSLYSWFRSKTRTRLGVDRRKHADQRRIPDRRRGPSSLLSREELDALLSDLPDLD